MCETWSLHLRICQKGGIQSLIELAKIGNDVTRQYCSGAICSLTKTKECRDILVEKGKSCHAFWG